MPKALIWGESIVGSGHARVQSELARALEEKGWDVSIVTSSLSHLADFDQGNARIITLPGAEIKSPDANPYNPEDYLTPNNKPPSQDAEWQAERQRITLKAYRDIQPDAVITEMWPYGRVYFDRELIPLAQAVQMDRRSPPPRLYSLARDIMFPSTQLSHTEESLKDRHAVVRKYFKPGSILIRGDKKFIALDESLGPIPEPMRPYFDYMGYFAKPIRPKSDGMPDDKGEVIVTAGGGISEPSLLMMRKAMEARKYTQLKDHIWRIIVSPRCPESEFEALRALAMAESPEGNIIVEHNRRDFSRLLSQAALLITHGGNTVIEAVSGGIPTLVVPLEYAENNREQMMRTARYHEQGVIESARMAEIVNAKDFAARIDAASNFCPEPYFIANNGAARMAETINQNYKRVEPVRTV